MLVYLLFPNLPCSLEKIRMKMNIHRNPVIPTKIQYRNVYHKFCIAELSIFNLIFSTFTTVHSGHDLSYITFKINITPRQLSLISSSCAIWFPRFTTVTYDHLFQCYTFWLCKRQSLTKADLMIFVLRLLKSITNLVALSWELHQGLASHSRPWLHVLWLSV